MQRNNILVLIVSTVLASLLAACGSSGGQSLGGGDETPGHPDVTPNPLDANVTLDENRASSQTVHLAGGTLEATAQDGTVYTLTMPPDALISDTEITMTPLTAVAAAPVNGGKLVGVKLEPEGLRLYSAATLTIRPADGNAALGAISFAYHERGKGFHLYPLEPDADKLSFKLFHFSGYLAYVDTGSGVALTAQPESFAPADWEAQLEHQMQPLIGHERQAALTGEPGDPQFNDKLEALLRSYFDHMVAPLLAGISTDCASLEANGARTLSWARTTHLLGYAETFAIENDAIMSSLIAGLKNCWNETVEPCLDWNHQVQVTRAVGIARQLVLLGESAAQYDPFDPELRCESCGGEQADMAAWQGTVTMSSYTKSGQNGDYSVSVERSAEVDVVIDEIFSNTATGISWTGGITGGQARIHDVRITTWVDPNAMDDVTGEGVPKESGSAGLYLDKATCTYDLGVNVRVDAHNSMIDRTVLSPVGDIYLGNLPVTDSLTLSGSRTIPVRAWYNVSDSTVTLAGGGTYTTDFAPLLERIIGEESMGTVQVSWNLRPIDASNP